MSNTNRIKAFLQKRSVLKKKFIFPFSPKETTICERRRDFLEQFTISSDYHLAILKYIDEQVGLKGKRVLELGGSNIPREIFLDDFAVKQYVGIDYIESWWADPNHKRERVNLLNDIKKAYNREEPYLLFSGSINDLTDDYLVKHFDVIISFSSIEHFEDMPLMLKKAFNVLKKGGIYFASSEPIWSSGKGHHFWITADYNFQVTPDFDYAHLIYDKRQFKKKFINIKDLDKVSRQVYDWNGINRLFYSEIETAVNASPFVFKEIYPFIIQKPPREVEDLLYKKYSNRAKNKEKFSKRGIQWILQK